VQSSVCPSITKSAQRKSWWSLRRASNGHKDWYVLALSLLPSLKRLLLLPLPYLRVMLHRLLDQDAYTAQEHSSSKHGSAAFNKQSAATKVQSQVHLHDQRP